MDAQKNIHANTSTAVTWRTAGRAAAVTALAAIVFLALWSPIAAQMTQGGRILPTIGSGDTSLAGGTKRNDHPNEADQLARNYSEWLRAAHRSAGATGEDLPLPPQF